MLGFYLSGGVIEAILTFFGNTLWFKQLFIAAVRGSAIVSDNIFMSFGI